MPITPEQARAELARRELARRAAAVAAPGAPPPGSPTTPAQDAAPPVPPPPAGPPAPSQPGQSPSTAEAAVRGAGQGVTLGFGEEMSAAVGAALQKLATNDPENYSDLYRRYRDEERAANSRAQEAHGGAYLAGQVAGGLATAVVPGGAAVKGASTAMKAVTAAKTIGTGVGIGAAAGLGESKADLTQGDVKGAATDAAIGGVVGGALTAAARPAASLAGKGIGAAADKLREFGQGRLFKAAVGQTKRAFTQMNGKGLLEKAGQYLDSMGIGVGDSTESIAKKLADRRDAIGTALTDTVEGLDSRSLGRVTINPADVAAQIEKKVAEPLKKLAAARGEYGQVMSEVQAIRDVGQPLTFGEAVAQRAAAQKQANYNVAQKQDIMAGARKEIARIWNAEIDKQAEPLLKQAGKAGDAYRELRHEFSLVEELSKHVQGRVSGNAANRWLSPSDYGAGGVTGIMSGNPVVGLAGVVANHVARVYGNAAAGRAAIGMAKMAAGSERAAEAILPKALRAGRVAPPTLERGAAAPALADQQPQPRPDLTTVALGGR